MRRIREGARHGGIGEERARSRATGIASGYSGAGCGNDTALRSRSRPFIPGIEALFPAGVGRLLGEPCVVKTAREPEFLIKLTGGQDAVWIHLAPEFFVQPASRPRRDRIRVAVKVKRKAANAGGEPTLLRGSQGVVSLRPDG